MHHFHNAHGSHEQNVVRWMTSFATTEAEVEAFAAAVRQEALAG